MDTLCDYHSVDIQWGNHDIVWMGAAAGHYACIANVIRMSAKYGNLDVLEDGYGINLLPLASFALDVYSKSDCSRFTLKGDDSRKQINTLMYKAITMLQFKLEGQLIEKHPEFLMDDRNLLKQIDYEKKTVHNSNLLFHGCVPLDENGR